MKRIHLMDKQGVRPLTMIQPMGGGVGTTIDDWIVVGDSEATEDPKDQAKNDSIPYNKSY